MFIRRKELKLGCFSNAFFARFRSSKWRKASKCKRHIENLLCSVRLHRKRRECMLNQSRSDISQLLPNGCFLEALSKTKQFYEDESRILAYDQIEYFCTSILQNFHLLKRQNNVHILPEETKEAMAGLIFAASRIGEVHELQYVRRLLVQRFGIKFEKDSVYLRTGNLVTPKIIKILDRTMPQDAISPETVLEIIHKQRTTIFVDSITDDSASCNNNNLGKADSDEVKNMKRIIG